MQRLSVHGVDTVRGRLHRLETSLTSPRARMHLRGRLLAPWWSHRFQEFGPGSVLQRPEWIDGAHRIAIGAGVTIHDGAWLAAEQSTWYEDGLGIRIGDHCLIRSNVTISACSSVLLGSGVTVGGGATIIDSDHTWRQGRPRVWENQSESTPLVVGDNTWIGDGARLLRGSSVGRYCIVAAGSVVRGALPDLVVAAGVPARVIGDVRNHMAPELWDRLASGDA